MTVTYIYHIAMANVLATDRRFNYNLFDTVLTVMLKVSSCDIRLILVWSAYCKSTALNLSNTLLSLKGMMARIMKKMGPTCTGD